VFACRSDAFAEAEGDGGDSSKVHIRVQQRNGRKCITLIEGLAEDLDIKRICKVERASCNNTTEWVWRVP
jgi:translation initiation factor 1